MRILAVVPNFPTNAKPDFVAVFFLRRLQAVAKRGHDVRVVRILPFAPPIGRKWERYRSFPDDEVVEGIRVQTIRAIFPPRLIGMETIPAQVHARLARVVEQFRPDVVHASFAIPCGQVAVRQDVPVVVSAHGIDAYDWPFRRPGLRAAAKEALLKASRLCAVSGFLAMKMREIVDRDVEVIWNGAEERLFYPRDPMEARQALALPQDRFIVAYAGNLLRAKGLFELIEAAQRMRAVRPLICLAGTGADEEPLRRLALEKGIDARFLGRLSHENVALTMSAADVVTLPSHREGLPNVVCEAMLSERAVVVSNAGGIPEIVENGVTGLVASIGESEALARALDRLAANETYRRNIAAAARAFARTHLTWSAAAQKYEALYEAAVCDPGGFGTRKIRATNRIHT